MTGPRNAPARGARRCAAAAFASAALAALPGPPTGAHHSYAQYDMCTSQTITGTIDRIEWANPHIIMMVDASDSTTYRIEWMNLRQLAMAGLERDVLLAGDQVVITGTKNRDPNVHIMTLLTEVSRPSDGFKWSRARSRTRSRPANCDAAP